jgi:CRP-like cAMP-binding protein
MKAHYQQEIAEEEERRTRILKSVSVFSSLSMEYLLAAAQSLERIIVQRGEDVIVQDEIGDAFYIVEKGTLVVKRKYNSNNDDEAAQVVGRLGPNSFFGEIALLTQEPRSATITVESTDARLLRMTKLVFDEVITKCNAAAEQASREVGREVVNKVPLFQTLNAANRQKILDMMSPMQFAVGVYICRQGTVGNTFYIIVDGLCRVTINTGDPLEPEKEVAKLSKGDFFGTLPH